MIHWGKIVTAVATFNWDGNFRWISSLLYSIYEWTPNAFSKRPSFTSWFNRLVNFHVSRLVQHHRGRNHKKSFSLFLFRLISTWIWNVFSWFVLLAWNLVRVFGLFISWHSATLLCAPSRPLMEVIAWVDCDAATDRSEECLIDAYPIDHSFGSSKSNNRKRIDRLLLSRVSLVRSRGRFQVSLNYYEPIIVCGLLKHSGHIWTPPCVNESWL